MQCSLLTCSLLISGILDICLDLNQNPSIPPELRYDISLPDRKQGVSETPNKVLSDITPEYANSLMLQYTQAVQLGQMPPIDLHVIRENIEERLAAQGVPPLSELERKTAHPRPGLADGALSQELMRDEVAASYLTAELEDAYLLRLDAKLGDPFAVGKMTDNTHQSEEKHLAELTPRELERQSELLNPQSQHNWLRTHAKPAPSAGAAWAGDVDDNESVDSPKASAHPRKRAPNKNLAKQLGDRAVDLARGNRDPMMSPSAASGQFDEEEIAMMEEIGGSASKKKGRDPDSTYRVKGGKGGGGGGKAKRKRTTEEGVGAGSATKKARIESGAGVGE